MVVGKISHGYDGNEGEGEKPIEEILGLMVEMRKKECSWQEKRRSAKQVNQGEHLHASMMKGKRGLLNSGCM